MTAPVIHIDGNRITERDSFHDEFADVLGFPGYYGRNMNAWIDCMSCLDEGDGMSQVTVEPGQILTLQIDNFQSLKERCPSLVSDLLECAAFVNWRRIEQGGSSVLALAFYD